MYHQTGLAAAAATLGLGGFGLHGCAEALSGPEAALLAIADPGLDCRVVIVAPGALELACALLRRGHSDVTMVRLCDRPRAGQADVVIIPGIASAEVLGRTVASARRMLAPLGTIVIRLATEMADASAQRAARELLLHGFAAVRTRTVFGDAILRAELPLYGQLKWA